MKITIDTKDDSPEEIRKAIQLLSNLIGEKHESQTNNIFDDDTPSNGSVFGNVFDQPKDPDKESKENVEIVEY